VNPSDFRRWLVATLALLGIIALLAWARNDPGVGGRLPDPPGAAGIMLTSDDVGVSWGSAL